MGLNFFWSLYWYTVISQIRVHNRVEKAYSNHADDENVICALYRQRTKMTTKGVENVYGLDEIRREVLRRVYSYTGHNNMMLSECRKKERESDRDRERERAKCMYEVEFQKRRENQKIADGCLYIIHLV